MDTASKCTNFRDCEYLQSLVHIKHKIYSFETLCVKHLLPGWYWVCTDEQIRDNGDYHLTGGTI